MKRIKKMLSVFTVLNLMMLMVFISNFSVFSAGIESYAMGCIQDTVESYAKLPKVASRSVSASLPSVVDLTSQFPTPGKQGSQGSCSAWAVAYAYKSFQEKADHGWNVGTSDHQFSPAYVYNQIQVGNDGGSSISDAMRLLVSQGVCSLADMPYSQNDYKTQPNVAQRQKAATYRALSYGTLTAGSVDEIKKQIASGDGVVIAISVYPDFDNLNSSNKVYDNVSGEKRGAHAICLIGYDNSLNAFKFINSWGTTWGINGYGYISYNLIRQFNTQAYVMVDIKNKVGISNKTVSGDFNGDDIDDVAAMYDMGNERMQMRVYLSNASGTYSESIWYESSIGGYNASRVAERMVAGDFNGDGRDDIACMYDCLNGTMQLHVFKSAATKFDGYSAWRSIMTAGYYDANKVTGRMVAGDFNGDGRDDIATMYAYAGDTTAIHVFKSTGINFEYFEKWYNQPSSGVYSVKRVTGRMVAGDFNRDGRDDIACMYEYDNNGMALHVFPSSGSGLYNPQTWYKPATQGSYCPSRVTERMVAGDFNGDGRDDIACMYEYDNNGMALHVFPSGTSSGNNVFYSPQTWYKPATQGSYTARAATRRMMAGDFNGDGKDDVSTMYDHSINKYKLHVFPSSGANFMGWSSWWSNY